MRTPLEVIAQRNLGRALAADEAERALRALMGDGYDRVRAQESRADTVVDGNGADDDALAALCQGVARNAVHLARALAASVGGLRDLLQGIRDKRSEEGDADTGRAIPRAE